MCICHSFPLQHIDVVRVLDADGATEVLNANTYVEDSASHPPRMMRKAQSFWPRPGRVLNWN